MRTSFVDGMGPWASTEDNKDVQTGPGPKGDARSGEVKVPQPAPVPAPEK